MKNKNQAKKILLFFIAGIIIILPSAIAHCPLCTGATVVGVGITRAWGLDDSIVGIFVGGMILSSALWVNNVLTKKGMKGNVFLRGTALFIIFSVMTLLTFYYAGLFGRGNPYRIFGIERIIFGSISGSAVSIAAFALSIYFKKKNNGRVFFNYQTMMLSISGLIANVILFLLIL